MVSYSIIRNALLALLVLLLLFQLSYAQYHPECGESPAQRYREVAKQHGWTWLQLIKFMKAEFPHEYERLLKAVKLYADCVVISRFPLYK